MPAQALRPAEVHRREIPYGRNENNRTRIPQSKCPRWLTAEKSHTAEMRTIVHDYPNTCPRRLCAPRWLTVEKSHTAETKTIVHDYPKANARGGSAPRNPLRQKQNNRTRLTQNTCPRWLTAEKSPTEETKTIVHAYPGQMPAVAHRREIPYGRNENNRTRIPQSKCPRRLCAPRWLTAVHDYPKTPALRRFTALTYYGQRNITNFKINNSRRRRTA